MSILDDRIDEVASLALQLDQLRKELKETKELLGWTEKSLIYHRDICKEFCIKTDQMYDLIGDGYLSQCSDNISASLDHMDRFIERMKSGNICVKPKGLRNKIKILFTYLFK